MNTTMPDTTTPETDELRRIGFSLSVATALQTCERLERQRNEALAILAQTILTRNQAATRIGHLEAQARATNEDSIKTLRLYEESQRQLETAKFGAVTPLAVLETDVTNLLDGVLAACIAMPGWQDQSPFKDPCDEFTAKHPDLAP